MGATSIGPASRPIGTRSGAEAAAISVDHVEVRRTAIVARCGPVGAPHGWMVLHGIHQRAADFIAPWTRVAGAAQRRVLAPEGLSRTILDFEKDTAGACWTTIPDRPIDLADTYAFLDLCHGARARLGRRRALGWRLAERRRSARPRRP
jgi:hypothetical protein